MLEGRPVEATDVLHVGRLADGRVPVEGDKWHSDLSVVFEKRSGELLIDLGEVRDIRAAYLVGDNNDRFLLDISADGESFTRLWFVPSARGAGMRMRARTGFRGQRGRYLRLRARGGDRYVSIGELAVFEEEPEVFPPALERLKGGSPDWLPKGLAWAFFGVMLLLASVAERQVPVWARVVQFGLWAAGLALLVWIGWYMWPPDRSVQRVLRMTVALAACALWVRGWVRAERVDTRVVQWGLGLCAAAALACFYNFYAPQFDNVAEDDMTYVHTWDMRVYYPIAKYFDELGFDGLYFASVAAYRTHGPGLSEGRLKNVRLRDLRTNKMTTGDQVKDAIEAAPERFSKARYEAFAKDMRFFWETMGGGYLSSLRDHGGNATPFWFFITHWMFRFTEASEGLFLLAGLLDPLLLGLLGWLIYRSFGLNWALVCLVVYGTTEFPQFGSNWSGSTLRNDWMVALGFAACALKKRKDGWGGFWLAISGLIRAFPVLCAVTVCVPLLGRWLRGEKDAFKRLRSVVGAGVGTVAVAVVLSGLTFGFEASWGAWFDKIALHTSDANVNHVGLQTVMSTDLDKTPRRLAEAGVPNPWGGWQQRQAETLFERRPWFIALAVFGVGLVLVAGLRSRPEQAALMGLLLVPVLMYPANYYMHGIFLLPLLGAGEKHGKHVVPVMLLWCAAQYICYVGTQTDERFYQLSVQLLCAIPVLLVPLALGWRSLGKVSGNTAEAPATEVGGDRAVG